MPSLKSKEQIHEAIPQSRDNAISIYTSIAFCFYSDPFFAPLDSGIPAFVFDKMFYRSDVNARYTQI